MSLASCLWWLQLGVDRNFRHTACAAICRFRRVAPGPLRLALPDPSIDDPTVGRREGSVSYVEESSWTGHDWRRQGLFREGLREVEGHWVWATGTKRKFDSARRCNSWARNRQQPYAYRGGGSSLQATEKSTNTPESADSLLSHGDFNFKDHNDGNHFLACEIDSRVAAHIYLELGGSGIKKKNFFYSTTSLLERKPETG